MAYKLLSGIRIIDLTMVYAGPVSTKIMAELGAEVIKVESAQRADVFTRANVYPDNQPGDEPWDRGCYFHSLNVGKRGISLNLGSQKGRDILLRLIQVSDVIIENFSPRVMSNWGLSYEDVRKVKQDIIMVSMSGLGHYGPLKDYYMYVPGMEGMSGLTHNTGFPEQVPLLSGYAYGDWITGAYAAMSLLTALFHLKSTGKGQYIDVSGREAAACQIGDIIMDYTLNKRDRARTGNAHPSMAPHGCYRCKGDDKWVNIAVENEEQWRRFCDVIGNPFVADDSRFCSLEDRLKNQKELDTLVEAFTVNHEHIEVMEMLQKVNIPAGAVLSMKDINLNPHLINRSFFQLIDHGESIGKRPIPSQIPAKFGGVESLSLRRAPHFGEDTEYVLNTLLGMSKEEITQLEKDNVIGKKPVFPPGRPTRTNLIERQRAGWFDPEYIDELSKVYGSNIGIHPASLPETDQDSNIP